MVGQIILTDDLSIRKVELTKAITLIVDKKENLPIFQPGSP